MAHHDDAFDPHRRSFLKRSTLGASWLALPPLGQAVAASEAPPRLPDGVPRLDPLPERALDLAPARWIWYPSGRVLQNTVVLFRRTLTLSRPPVSATGWILGDSRYRLFVNGRRIQWGPAPSDPRFAEADPLDLTDALTAGPNVLGAEVLYFGQGDGTWPIGKAGFIFHLTLSYADGTAETVVSDGDWLTHLARSWPPGQYKRWYLRAFQESFDARHYPYGWTDPAFATDADWLPAMDLDGRSDRPAVCTRGRDYLYDSEGDPDVAQLRRRQVPMLDEPLVGGAVLRESLWIDWKRPSVEYFDSLTPEAFTVDRTPCARQEKAGAWRVDLDGSRGAALTFAFDEQVVGWPYFTITAPAGTVIEMMVHEAHAVGGPALLNTRFNSWTRFVCRDGRNRFEPFDFESLRWLQLHIHGATGPVVVEDVGVRRRKYPWPAPAEATCSDPVIQQVWDASVNTLYNCAQDTIVDCMGRERQQYSGDVGHVLHAVFLAFGETRLPARYVDTFSQGLTHSGYYMDSWPAYDRLARIPQRELQLTRWGPILDHGVGHAFDAYYSYLYSGALEPLAEVYPRLLRFAAYLERLVGADALLPVEDLGTPIVWIDHDAYRQQRHKQCAFNLYAVAMLRHALRPLCEAHGDADTAARVAAFADELHAATIRSYWSPREDAFVANLPWLDLEAGTRFCDRSLALSVLYDLTPNGLTRQAVRLLADAPDELGLSYPANAGWRLWALARAGRIDAVLHDLRNRWGSMRSVHENHTLSETWTPGYDGTDQWSHAPVAPLYMAYMGLAGITPTAPGFERYAIRPQPGDLERLYLTARTVRGPIRFEADGPPGDRTLVLKLPESGAGTLVVDARETVDLPGVPHGGLRGTTAYALPAGETVRLSLTYT